MLNADNSRLIDSSDARLQLAAYQLARAEPRAGDRAVRISISAIRYPDAGACASSTTEASLLLEVGCYCC